MLATSASPCSGVPLRRFAGPARAGVALLTMLLGGAGTLHAEVDSREAAVRAAFLYRLAFFVSWPQGAFESERSPVRFCMLSVGSSAVADMLSSQAKGRTVLDRPIEVVHSAELESGKSCHIVYAEGKTPLPSAPPAHALLVVDSLPTLAQAGTLALVTDQQPSGEVRLAFVARRERLTNTQFSLSAKLLQLVRFESSPG